MVRKFIYGLTVLLISLPVLAEERAEPFLAAAKAGHASTVSSFLAQGVNVNVEDWAGWPAINWAALMLRNDTIEILLESGADIEFLAKGGKNSGRPLMMAAKKYNGLETAKLLVARGADVNGADQYGRTALIMAARYGRIQTVHFLLSQGADPNAESIMRKWKTPLIAAQLRGHEDIVSLLIEAGAK